MDPVGKNVKKAPIALLLVAVLVGTLPGSDRFFLSLAADGILSPDSGFKEVYGKIQLSPDVKLGWEPFRGVILWTGYGLAIATGTILQLKEETKSTQHFLSAGIGLQARLFSNASWLVYAGWCEILYHEESMGLSFSDSVFGFSEGSDIRFFLGKKYFVSVSVSYIHASATARPPQSEAVKIKPGGLRLGGGIGFIF
jgi:hypothetical protein